MISNQNQNLVFLGNISPPTHVGDGGGTGTAPNVPINLDITDASVAANSILTWTNPAGGSVPDTNEIWKSTDYGATYAFYASVAGNVHTYTDTGAMANGGWFYYKVRAGNLGVFSGFSNVVSCTNNVDLHIANPFPAMIFPELIQAYGDLNLGYLGATFPHDIICNALRKVRGSLLLANMTSATITQALFPALTFIGTDFESHDSGFLTKIDLSALTHLGRCLHGYNSTALTTLLINSVTFTSFPTSDVNGDVNFFNCALVLGDSGSGVAGVIHRCFVSGIHNSFILLHGGTNAGAASFSAGTNAELATLLIDNTVSTN